MGDGARGNFFRKREKGEDSKEKNRVRGEHEGPPLKSDEAELSIPGTKKQGNSSV